MPWLTPALPAFSPATHPYLTIRPLAPLEAGPLQAVFQGLSTKSRQLRYHTPVSVLRPAMLRHLTDVDPGRHVAVVATFGGRPVGIGRWLRDPLRPTEAELAVEVIDRCHGLGIGTALAAEAARLAVHAGVDTLVAHIDSANTAARGWARVLGAAPHPDDPEQVRIAAAALAPDIPRHHPAA